MAFETEKWPYIAARHQGPKRTGDLRHIVLHDAESPERNGGARAIANYFANTDRVASAHLCTDNREIIQCVPDSRVAYAAPGANHDGYQIEQMGYARQTRAEWLDDYSVANIDRAADASAQICLKYGLPPVLLTNDQLAANWKGIVHHMQVSQVFRKSSHWDCGYSYPFDVFASRLKHHYERWKPKPETPPPSPKEPPPPYDYEVAVTWANDPDEGAARVLGAAHAWAVVPAMSNALIGLRIAVGHEAGDEVLQGATRTHTASLVSSRVCDRAWADTIRRRGRELALRRRESG